MKYANYYYGLIAAENYEELKDLSPVWREAKIFRKTLERIDLHLDDTDVLAGRYGAESPVEYEKKSFTQLNVYDEGEKRIFDALSSGFLIQSYFGRGHTCIAYERVLKYGLEDYVRRINERMEDAALSEQEREYLDAMRYAAESAKILSERFAELAEARMNAAADDDTRESFRRMRDALRRVPMKPSRDFYEAIQAVWLMHMMTPLSDNSWASISLGRFDQYMYPFYEAADEEEKKRIPDYVAALIRLLDGFGGDGACAFNLGGQDAEGRDQMNELTKVIIGVEKELCLRAPIIAARISDQTPAEMIDMLIDPKLFMVGQPTFYGEKECRRSMMYRGLTEEEASEFSVNSCMGLVRAGEEIADMWGCMFNMHLPLELAVNEGRPFRGELPMEIDILPGKPESEEELLKYYRHYLAVLLPYGLRANEASAQNTAKNLPNPFLSLLTEECIQKACDRVNGARYRTVTVETMALINTGDALAAIDELVFRKGEYTLDEMVRAAIANYEGCEKLRSRMVRCAKYGQGNETADRMSSMLFEMAAEELKKYECGNARYYGSLHTLTSNVWYGAEMGATLDGRLAGQPVNKNAGPSDIVRTSDPVGVIQSAGSMPQYLFSGGQPIDIRFDPDLVGRQREKVRALIMTYFSMGGMQLQVNSLDCEVLRDAMDHPDRHGGLIVRIGGYSEYFTRLDRRVQAEFVERFEREKA